VERLAERDSSIVIEGETGTGKELIARSLHGNSSRRDAAFLPIDCGALPDNLMENELFGHERGAFTGADSRKPGLLEAAQGGTVFLDEVANLSLDLQVKLLRALQERRVRRLGGQEEIEVDFRLISAANESLEEAMHAGRFRQDLFYRLSVVTLTLPPLRQREGDVAVLAEHFVARLNEAGPKAGGRSGQSDAGRAGAVSLARDTARVAERRGERTQPVPGPPHRASRFARPDPFRPEGSRSGNIRRFRGRAAPVRARVPRNIAATLCGQRITCCTGVRHAPVYT